MQGILSCVMLNKLKSVVSGAQVCAEAKNEKKENARQSNEVFMNIVLW